MGGRVRTDADRTCEGWEGGVAGAVEALRAPSALKGRERESGEGLELLALVFTLPDPLVDFKPRASRVRH